MVRDSKGTSLPPTQNVSYLFALKKSERLLSAILLVFKGEIKGHPLILDILEQSLSFNKQLYQLGVRAEMEMSDSLQYTVARLIGLLDIALSARLLSMMNHRILKEESVRLMDVLRTLPLDLRAPELPITFFDIDTELAPSKPAALVSMDDFSSIHTNKNDRKIDRMSGTPFSRIRNTADQSFNSKPTSKNSEVHSSDRLIERQSRRTAILAIVSEKGRVGIKDISRRVPGVSEKTIQRELISLVTEGVLLKQGDRRWSTYSLKVGVNE